MSNKPVPRPPATTSMTPQVLDKLLDVQARELELRARELDLRELDLKNTLTFANKGIEEQAKDRRDERANALQSHKHTLIFWAFIVLLAVSFLTYTVRANKENIALEVIKGIILVGGGYASGRFHQKTKDDKAKDAG